MTEPTPSSPDANQLARAVVMAATGEPPPAGLPAHPRGKNPDAVALGRLGGSKGGNARARTLSKARRGEIARLAVAARWNRRRGITAEVLRARRQELLDLIARDERLAEAALREVARHAADAATAVVRLAESDLQIERFWRNVND